MLTIRLIKARRGFFEDISVSLWFRIMKTAENLNNQAIVRKGFLERKYGKVSLRGSEIHRYGSDP